MSRRRRLLPLEIRVLKVLRDKGGYHTAKSISEDLGSDKSGVHDALVNLVFVKFASRVVLPGKRFIYIYSGDKVNV